jgi:hypothetical protein
LTIQQVILPAGTGKQIDFGRAFAKIIISDPNVIDALPINDHDIFIRPHLEEKTKETDRSGNTSTDNSKSTSTDNSKSTETEYSKSKPLRYGNSDVNVYDKDNNRIGIIAVIIDEFAFIRNVPVLPDKFAVRAGFIVVYRGTRQSYYRCASEIVGGCINVGN